MPDRLCLVVVRGRALGTRHALVDNENRIGQSAACEVVVQDAGVSRMHARIVVVGEDIDVEDMRSVQGTRVNGRKIQARTRISVGDRVALGSECVLEIALVSSAEVSVAHAKSTWSPDSWRTRENTRQQVDYPDREALAKVVTRLRSLPPLVTSWEVERLKSLIADAQDGNRFLLQGGDCAETFADCNSSIVTSKLKILLQMSLVLIHGAQRPVIRVGRLAGQYAKPRSKPTETREGVELRSYLGDLVNRPEFTAEARTPDPNLLLAGYFHAALTLNFTRALSRGGFADLRHPEYFDLTFFERNDLPGVLKEQYARIAEGLRFVRALGDDMMDDLVKVEFFTSHEGLNLEYEAAQTRTVPRRAGWYDLTAHLPWIGERTRALDGGHIEFFRGVSNPIGVKLGPSTSPEQAVELCDALNPSDEPGKLIFIVRMGQKEVESKLPPIIEAIERERRRVLWVSDPMHGNMITTKAGIKTRNFDDILREIELSFDIHHRMGTIFGGVHFELTGEDVTECLGSGIREEDLDLRYLTACDPRLNYRQAMEMAFALAERMAVTRRPQK